MRKVAIITRIANETGLTQFQAEKILNVILQEIKDSLQRGEPITLRQFGSFQVHAKRARMGRNPKTGEEAGIPARRVVRFKSGKHFRESVNDASRARRSPS
jgi:nucleoid DNA-binding protein